MTYQVKIQAFEGPFDLLLHLIKENEIDIYDIPIAQITAEYLSYLQAMQELDLEVTSDFLVMAATLLSIKARMLLPPAAATEETTEYVDAREELVKDILEYLRFKEVAADLWQIRQEEILHYYRPNEEELYVNLFSEENPVAGKTLSDLTAAFAKVLAKAAKEQISAINIPRERITVQDKLMELPLLLRKRPQGISFSQIFSPTASRIELIVTFLALLELARNKQLIIAQNQPYEEIYFYPSSAVLQAVAN